MSFIEDSQILEVRFAATALSQAAINVRHYIASSVLGGTVTTDDFAATLSAVIPALYKAIMSDQAVYYGLSVQKIFPVPPAVASVDYTGQAAGSVNSDILPGQVTGILTMRTANAGPGFRGRNYIPFPPESLNTDGIPTSTYMTGLTNLADKFDDSWVVTAGASTATLSPVLWNRATLTPTAITAAQARQKWATQRRRGNYGQRNVAPF